MFNSLLGTITAKLPNCVYLQTNGIEWDLFVPETSVNALPPVGDEARVFTWLYHKEDSMKLFGFSSVEERSIFLDLLKVDGVGPKGAVKILSSVKAKDLASALEDGDLSVLEKLPGIGKKTAQKMMLTLKGKLTLSDDQYVIKVPKKQDSAWNDVIVALCDMGFERKNVEEAVAKTFPKIDNSLSKADAEEALFRQVLVELAK